MRVYLLNKWIRELNQEIQRAKQEQNLAKLLDLESLLRSMVKILESPN